jgi:1-deoxy-D-xylulose-5-phosphate synthase
MHYVFDVEKDPFIFDVSHQAYAHKLLTDRYDNFHSLRKFNGLSGFTNPKESKYDYFIAGHSSTSVSLALGAAKAIYLKKEDRIPVCMIGDGSMSAGLVYEALNELGERKYPLIIILNDNEMSISKPIGAISKHLSKLLSKSGYQKFKKSLKPIINKLPNSLSYILKKIDKSFKIITPGGIIFEELGIEYIGPVDGNNIKEMIDTLSIAKAMKKPVIIHAQTIKGKGYKIAEGAKENWHGVSSFDITTGKSNNKTIVKNPTTIFSEYLLSLADKRDDIVGFTAAMPSGTGLSKLIEKYPNRFFDVAIAEQHAITSSASMAKEGLKPFVAIYSTFLQRAYDQIIHDVCILKLPVVFVIDRAGIVGEDGETHQGVFDVSFLRAVPNMTIFAPRDNKMLEYAIDFASEFSNTCAFRFPRGKFDLDDNIFQSKRFSLAKSQMLIEEKGEMLFIGYGNGIGKAYSVISKLKEINKNINISLLDLCFIKPLDKERLIKLSHKYKKWYIFSDTVYMGGVASAILELLSKENIIDIFIKSFEYDDQFITHGAKDIIEDSLDISIDKIMRYFS